MSNFDFLKKEYPELAKLAYLAECYYENDPASALAKMRTFCEFIVKDIYIQEASLSPDLKFTDLIKYCRMNELIPDKIANLIDVIRIKGNYAVHEQKGTVKEALESLNNIYFIAYWYFMLKTDTKPEFKPFVIPTNEDKKVIDEQKKLIESLQKQIDEQVKVQKVNEEKVIQFKKRSSSISEYKEFTITEKQTRQKLIDLKLQKQGWNIIDFKEGIELGSLDNIAVREFPTKEGFADYVLFVKGKLLGIIEAKKISVGSKNVIEQAKRYSKDTLNGVGTWREYKVPFLYSTNGETICFLDIRNEKNIQRELMEFHNAIALEEKFNQKTIDYESWLKKNQ